MRRLRPMATINELRRLVASGEPPSMSVLLVTIGHGADLPATCNVHVRLQLGEQVWGSWSIMPRRYGPDV